MLDPIEVDRDAAFVLRNLPSPVTNTGVELLGTWRRAPFSATATYTFVRALERPDGVEIQCAADPTPQRRTRRHVGARGHGTRSDSSGITPASSGSRRIRIRTESKPYMVFGALVERRFGRYRLFVNGENLADVRQTDWDPLIRPTRGVDGRWTVDAWAPLDGRNINGGVRIAF